MASTPSPIQSSPNRREIKRLVLILVASIAVLDAAIISLYYAAHVQDRPVKTQQSFVAVWVVLTLIVVTTMMKKIRQARRGR
jgi:hypothetical protein